MAGRINREDIDRLREQADALAVIGDHATLKRAGKSWKGLCPFHTEKTPSFHVMPEEGRWWYCYGCSEGGDLIDFLRRIDGLDFIEAVETLARRTRHHPALRGAVGPAAQGAGRAGADAGGQPRRDGVVRSSSCSSERGTVARQYLKERGFGKQDAERFRLGFAPEEWDAPRPPPDRAGGLRPPGRAGGAAGQAQHRGAA